MPRPKKNSYKEYDNEKKFLPLKNSPPPPPRNFSNGPSLNKVDLTWIGIAIILQLHPGGVCIPQYKPHKYVPPKGRVFAPFWS